jgi:hypothetical protein
MAHASALKALFPQLTDPAVATASLAGGDLAPPQVAHANRGENKLNRQRRSFYSRDGKQSNLCARRNLISSRKKLPMPLHGTQRSCWTSGPAGSRLEATGVDFKLAKCSMITIRFADRETEKRALAFLLGRFSGRVLKSGEHIVPEAALEALADQGIAFSVQGTAIYEQQVAALRGTSAPVVQ